MKLRRQFTVSLLVQHFLFLDRSFAGINHHIAFKVENPFQIFQGKIQQVADAAGQSLEKPDMGARGGKFDVPHPFPPDLREGNLDAAFVADHTAVLHPLVLAAQAFPIRHRSEDAGTEQAVPFRLKGSIVDRLRLDHFAVRPGADLFRGCQADSDTVEINHGTDAIIRAAAIQGRLLQQATGCGNGSGGRLRLNFRTRRRDRRRVSY